MIPSVQVVGGAGDVGSHMAKALAKASHTVIVFDNLATGHRDAVRYGAFVEGDLHNIVRTVLDWMHTRS